MTTSTRRVCKALVADDDANVKRRLVRALAAVWPGLELIEASDGIDAWDRFLQHEPDICFLDVRMPGLTGIEVAQRIADRARIVFLTIAKDHVLPTLESGEVLHLVKPLEAARLADVVARLQASMQPWQRASLPSLHHLLDKLASQLRRPAPVEAIETGELPGTQWMKVDDIEYFEADSRGTRAVSAAGEAVVRMPLKQLVAQLDPGRFTQINRFAVVNQRHIQDTRRLDDDTMVLSLRERAKTLAVSRHFQPLFDGKAPEGRAEEL